MVIFYYVLHFDIGLFCAPECFVQGNFLEPVFLIDVYGGLERTARDQRQLSRPLGYRVLHASRKHRASRARSGILPDCC